MFLHVPKTGGNWVTQVLNHLGLIERAIGKPHTTYDRLFWYDRFHHDDKVARNLLRRRLGLIPRLDPNGFKFCFVREPLEWYVSWWRFMEGRTWRNWGDECNPYHWAAVAMMNGLGSPDFNTFVDNVNRKRPGFVTELYGWYVRPGVHFVGHQENLRRDVLAVLAKMGIRIDPAEVNHFPHANVSSADVPRPEWDPALRRKTLLLEAAGYARYGYAWPEETLALDVSFNETKTAA